MNNQYLLRTLRVHRAKFNNQFMLMLHLGKNFAYNVRKILAINKSLLNDLFFSNQNKIVVKKLFSNNYAILLIHYFKHQKLTLINRNFSIVV